VAIKGERYWRIEFRVSGTGRFPFDMLRYDSCVPKEGITNLGDPPRDEWMEPREVTLIRYTHIKTNGPTVERWLSFGWAVVAGSERLI
jgi:hypothetical protein